MVRYNDEIIDEIRNKNDIVDTISQYVILKRSGRNFMGLCPFHKEKSPSFSVSPDKQIFHCFGCGVGGNVFHFVSKIENMNFKETLEMLADKSGVNLPLLENDIDNETTFLKSKVYEINKLTAEFYHENLYKPSAKLAQEYVKKRKLDNNILKSFLIGYSSSYNELYQYIKSKGYTEEQILASSLVNKMPDGNLVDRFRKRLMFPIQDVRGRVIAFGGRVLDDTKPKYINSPENIVYHKGRHLYGLNIAKKTEHKKIIVVEGYMDVVSLYQRGITGAVASLGTAMTEMQGRLLRNSSEQVIIGYDADGAGQAATMRGLEILQNLGCDIRILQIEGAKDPDEFVVKYGAERFEKQVENAISLVEYKIKTLQRELKLESVNDKIKFLKEIAKVLSKIDNNIELEVYISKIALEYNISKEAILAEITKLTNKATVSTKILEKAKPKLEEDKQENKIDEQTKKRERLIIYLLINYKEQCFTMIKQNITIEDMKLEVHQTILKKLYEEQEKGNSNNEDILSYFSEEEVINELSWIMAYDFEIGELAKCIEDILNSYQKEKVMLRRNEILRKLEDKEIGKEEIIALEKELNDIILKLAKIK